MTSIAFRPTTPIDFEPLLALRLVVMRESLERLGRFDPERARARFAGEFALGQTRVILADGEPVGCVSFGPGEDGVLQIANFYIQAHRQGAGLGGAVMAALLAEAGGQAVRLSVLKESAANRFYQRFGFVPTHEEAWDVYYERPAQPSASRK
jgi:predicted N-acetyltransferase YhbS